RRSHASDPDRWMSVNISSKQFMQSTMMEEVADALRETGFPAANVKLEITESVLMHNAESATAMMLQLRALDLQVAIDDFGTGYSSLSYLHRFPIDLLKIDRSFISAMGRENKNAEIVRTVIALARSLGMEVTAEGIESEEQLAILKELGCTYGQGFFFSEAVPPKLAFAS
ncbi:EAL domain-containing protein, partial [Candidatus Sumerlaeota bacterium]|nr:EAL domain-containing protein [Candidatus Sumerlaeota bacterium]